MRSDFYLSPFVAGDGENIAIHDWPLSGDLPDQAIQGTVIIVHGLGEHAFRYGHVANFLNALGYHVRAYDQYGHGESGGSPGTIPTEMRLVEDLADVVDDTYRQMQAGRKLILLGHSMGGVVVGSFVRQRMRPVDAIVFSSPAFDLGLTTAQKILLSTLPHFAPNWLLDNGLRLDKLCRDPMVVQAYRSDSFVHSKVSGRLARFIADEGARIIAAATQWQTPTLLMYAGADALVSPAGSRAFAQAAPTKYVQANCFETMFHEILNDTERALVMDTMATWLKRLR